MMRHKFAVGVLSAAWLMFPAIVHAQCTRCCGAQFFETSLAVTPTATEEKQPVTVTVGVASCYISQKVFTATVNITPTVPACASFADAFKVSGLIEPHGHRVFTYTLPAPNCESTYNVKLNGTRLFGTTTATLKVD
jgi:hypothetical protein